MERSLFRPSQVELSVLPLVGTMQKVEIERAAALLLIVLSDLGDEFIPVTWQVMRDTLAPKIGSDRIVSALLSCPFAQPDFRGFAQSKFGTWDERTEAIGFSGAGIAAICRYVRPAPRPDGTATKDGGA